MTRYIIRRILGLIPVLVGISLLTFTLTRVIPADPALLILGERATLESRERLRETLGLNEPLFFNPAAVAETGNPSRLFDSQYFNFVGGAPAIWDVRTSPASTCATGCRSASRRPSSWPSPR